MLELNLKLDELNSLRARSFFDTYELETIAGDSKTKLYLGNKDEQACRFCNRNKNEVTFKSDAHVIPQFMGNKNLLSYFECDRCNTLFSKYEDSFANFFGITRTFSQIQGQSNKVPKYKDPKTGLEVFLTDTGIQMTTIGEKNVFKIDEESKSVEIITERPGYIPIHIPKTIIKIGLSLLPDDEVLDYDQARRFIIQKEKDGFFIDNTLLRIFGYFIPGPPKFRKPFVQLYRRKDEVSKLCPYRQVILYYSNYCFQMTLPFSENDIHLQGKDIQLPIFPLLIDKSHFEKYGEYQQLNLNLTSNEKKTGEEHRLVFSFENTRYDFEN